MSNYNDPRFAACDTHLAECLRQSVPADQGRGARVVNLTTPSSTYMCGCGTPAHWFIRIYEPEPL